MTDTVRCKVCGTLFSGVDETEVERWTAAHIVGEHDEQLPDRIIEDAEERLEAMCGGENDD